MIRLTSAFLIVALALVVMPERVTAGSNTYTCTIKAGISLTQTPETGYLNWL
jgi:hypothetical protein